MLGNYLENVRKEKPLIHCITNYVTVNDVANALLACGASPVMSDEPSDVTDITAISKGLTINIGTLSERSIKAMHTAGKIAKDLNHVILLDPVGAGASRFRTHTAAHLTDELKPDIIRGNISEIKALAKESETTRGVDANTAHMVSEENLRDAVSFAKDFSRKTGAIIAITGAIDLVSDFEKCFVIRNGRPEMSAVTGTGCQLSGLCTAFAAANSENTLSAVASAVCMMGLAGEIAYSNLAEGEGNLSYRNRIIDAIYNMNADILNKGASYEIM